MKQLIDELRKELDGEPSNDAEAGYDSGILCAIAIIEKHLADKAIVPLEPTDAAIFNIREYVRDIRGASGFVPEARVSKLIYKAMIAANKGE